jgi:pyruvate formate lyase activating enzyme
MDIIEKERHIYRRSGGGITCTGGEPLLQARFLQHLLAKCHEVGIHTTLETSGYARKSEFQKTLTNLDWLFFDLKHINGGQHKKLTGKDNALILGNLRLASSFFGHMGRVLVIRQVIVPGLNDEINIRAVAELAGQLPHVDMIELLPYHNYGMHKYKSLGREYSLKEIGPPSEDKLKEYKEIIESSGIECKIGGL